MTTAGFVLRLAMVLLGLAVLFLMASFYPVLNIPIGLVGLAYILQMPFLSIKTGRFWLSQDPRENRATAPVRFWITLVLVSLSLGRSAIRLIEDGLAAWPTP